MFDITIPADVQLDSELQNTVVTEINSVLKSGKNSVSIPISYLLLDYIIGLYGVEWNISAKEYKASIKLIFKPNNSLVELETS